MATHIQASTDWLARAHSLASVVADHRAQGDSERHLSEEVIQAFRDADFLRMLAAPGLGGEAVPPTLALPVFEAMARQDGSSGWTLMFAATSSMFLDYLPEHVARRIFGSEGAILASNFSPKGGLTPVEGGYRLSGRWPFMSGCAAAEWHIVSAFVLGSDGQPRQNPDGSPEMAIAILPVGDAEIIDTWHTTGMRGTGSHDIAVRDVFIPDDHAFAYSQFVSGPSRVNAGYHRPFFEMAPALLASIGLGIAGAAIEELTLLAQSKTPLRATQRLADQTLVHDKVGRATALLESARAYLHETMRAVELRRPDEAPYLLRVRLAAAHAAQCAAESVSLMYEAGGGTSIYESSRLEACFRDANTLTHHFLVAPGAYATAGEDILRRSG